jgi:hypothetical protein
MNHAVQLDNSSMSESIYVQDLLFSWCLKKPDEISKCADNYEILVLLMHARIWY